MNGLLKEIVIREMTGCREELLPLLIEGDEQESLVRGYMNDGRAFVAALGEEIIAVALIVRLSHDKWEIKNIAVDSRYRRYGIGTALMQYVETVCGAGQTIMVGTGEAPRTLNFYRKCGYAFSHRVSDFFVDNYDHPVFDDGVHLRDMIYFVKLT